MISIALECIFPSLTAPLPFLAGVRAEIQKENTPHDLLHDRKLHLRCFYVISLLLPAAGRTGSHRSLDIWTTDAP